MAIVNFPILTGLERRLIPRGLSILITVGLNILTVGFIIYLGTSAISAFQKDRARYFVGLRSTATKAATWLEEKAEVEGAKAKVQALLDDRNGLIQEVLQMDIASNLGNMLATFSTSVLGKVSGVVSTAFFVLIVMIFALIEGRNIGDKIALIRESRGPDLRGFLSSADDIQRYLRIKTVASMVTGLLAGLLCWFVGLDYAFLWGLLAFVLNFIPVVGSILAGILPVILGLILLGPLPALGILLGFLAINVVIGNFIEPQLLGKRFGVSTLVIILAVFFWGWMWGPLGMFLAVPLTMVVKVILDNSDDFRWLSVAMGKGNLDEERILKEQELAEQRRTKRQEAEEARTAASDSGTGSTTQRLPIFGKSKGRKKG